MSKDLSDEQKNQLGYYEYKGYVPELDTATMKYDKQPLPEDIQKIFNTLNSTGLSHPRDPLCADINYTKNKFRWSVIPEETRVQKPPQQISREYESWYLNDWKQRSRIHKILSILWWLPSHLYRKYLASIDYRWYYNGLVSYIERTRNKLIKQN